VQAQLKTKPGKTCGFHNGASKQGQYCINPHRDAATWKTSHTWCGTWCINTGGYGKQEKPAPIKTGWALTTAPSLEVEHMSRPVRANVAKKKERGGPSVFGKNNNSNMDVVGSGKRHQV